MTTGENSPPRKTVTKSDNVTFPHVISIVQDESESSRQLAAVLSAKGLLCSLTNKLNNLVKEPSSVKITTSLMYLNTNRTICKDINSIFGAKYKDQELRGTLEIVTFCDQHVWPHPYIDIPYFVGEKQIIGAPQALFQKKIGVVNNVLEIIETNKDGLGAYFNRNKEILLSFMSIPIKSTVQGFSGVLNINANEVNFFDDIKIGKITKIIEDYIPNFEYLLSSMILKDTPDIPADDSNKSNRISNLVKKSKGLDKLIFSIYNSAELSPPLIKDLPEDKVRNVNENLWMLESIFGEKAVNDKKNKTNGALDSTGIVELFSKIRYEFFVSEDKKIILTQNKGIMQRYGPFLPVDPLEAIMLFPIECIEESIEKGISSIDRF